MNDAKTIRVADALIEGGADLVMGAMCAAGMYMVPRPRDVVEQTKVLVRKILADPEPPAAKQEAPINMTASNQTTDALPVVYVAGPYSADNIQRVFANIRNGIEACEQLIMYGFAPICPWQDFVYLLRSRKSTADLKDVSMAQLRKADAVYVVTSGPDYRTSAGTLAEIDEANRLGIPVFCGPDGLDGSDGLLDWRKNKWVSV